MRSALLRLFGEPGTRRRTATSSLTLGACAVALLVAMFLADGFRASTFDLDDARVWVTRRGELGRVNVMALDQDQRRQPQGIKGANGESELPTSLDVVQDGRTVLAWDAEGTAAWAIQPETADPGPPIPLGSSGAGSDIHLSGTRLAMVRQGGQVSVGSTRSLEGVLLDGVKARLELGPNGEITVGRSGDVWAVASEGSGVQLHHWQPSGSSSKRIDLDAAGSLQIAAVGDRPVVLDAQSRRLSVDGNAPRTLPEELGEHLALQEAGGASREVLISGTGGLWAFPLGDGAARSLYETRDPAGVTAVAPPVRVAGCAWAAFNGAQAVVAVSCGGEPAVDYPLADARPNSDRTAPLDAGEELRFRVNGRYVVLNATASGATFVVANDGIHQIDDWEGPRSSGTSTSTTSTLLEEEPLKLDGPNDPPRAEDDTHFGARANVPTPLSVLDNDRDPNGDVLTVKVVEGSVSPATATVREVSNRQAIQVLAPEGPVTFRYEVDDGRGGTDEATVTVRIVPPDVNRAPEPKPDWTPAPFQVEARRSGSYDVVRNFYDPDGDPIVLTSASVSAPNSVLADPTGILTFSDRAGVAAQYSIAFGLRDVPPASVTKPSESTEGDQPVEVVAPGQQVPPILQPDYVITAPSQPVVIRPLANDYDPNGDRLSIVRHEPPIVPTGATPPEIVVNTDGTIVFRPDETVATYRFLYEVSDGQHLVSGLIRVDVLPPENRPPAAGRDLVVLPVMPGESSRTVDLLVNDFDPDGDVLVVQSVDLPPGTGLNARLMDRRRLRVSTVGVLPQPVTLKYKVHDGRTAAEGDVVVVSLPMDVSSFQVVANPDHVKVRTGELIGIPVLANDIDPLGGDLFLRPDLAEPPPDGNGIAWVTGRQVRFMAPDEPGRVTFHYQIAQSADPLAPTVPGQVTVDVVPESDQNSAPVARLVEARVLAGGTVQIPIPLTDIDPDGDSVHLVGLAASGSGAMTPSRGRVVTPVGSDSITYQAFELPDADGGGTDQLTYEVRDSRGASSIGLVRVGVVPRASVNQAPVAVDDFVTVRPGSVVRVPVLANDHDPDDDPLSLDPKSVSDADGVRAHVPEGENYVEVEVRGSGPVAPVAYTVKDPSGGVDDGSIFIQVAPDARGLPPVARDDRVTDVQPNRGEREVDVVANDYDPDGTIVGLDPALVIEGVKAELPNLTVPVTDSDQVIPYRITDDDGLTAVAVVRVPGRSTNLPPQPKAIQPIEVQAGSTRSIELDEVVADPEGKPVRITFESTVHGAPSQFAGGVRIESHEKISVTPPETFSGDAAVVLEVTDGSSGDDPAGARTTLSIPIRVIPKGGAVPPRWRTGPYVEAAWGEPGQEVDLAPLVDHEDPGQLRFGHSQAPQGVKLTVRGSRLRVEVTDDVLEGQPYADRSFMVSVRGSSGEPVEKEGLIRIVRSTRREPTCSPQVVDEVSAGKEFRFDVAAACDNPYPETPLKVVPGRSDVRSDGTALLVTPPAGTLGDFVVTYRVMDKVGREASSSVTARVRDVPGRPPPPTVSVASHQVTLSMVAPPSNGAPILQYWVEWNGGNRKDCPAVCTIEGLRNNVEYTFRVRAENAVGAGPESEPVTARPDERPPAPTWVTLRFDPAHPDGKLVAEWSPVEPDGSPILNYEVTITPPPTHGLPTRTTDGPQTRMLIDGLENGATYSVTVRARNSSADGLGDPAQSDNAKPAKPPSAPVIDEAERVITQLGGVARIKWRAPEDSGGAEISGYAIRVEQADGTVVKEVPAGPQEREKQIDSLDNRGTYRFVVIAENIAGRSESEPSQEVRPGGLPDPISDLKVDVAEGNVGLDRKVRLRFTVPSTNSQGSITGYRVLINDAVRTVPMSAPPLVIDRLENGRDYSIRVIACSQSECATSESNAVTARPYGPVGQPSISVLSRDYTGVTFRVQRPTANGRAVVSVDVVGHGSLGPGETHRDFRISGLCNGSWGVTAIARDEAGQQASGSGTVTSATCPSVTVDLADFTRIAAPQVCAPDDGAGVLDRPNYDNANRIGCALRGSSWTAVCYVAETGRAIRNHDLVELDGAFGINFEGRRGYLYRHWLLNKPDGLGLPAC